MKHSKTSMGRRQSSFWLILFMLLKAAAIFTILALALRLTDMLTEIFEGLFEFLHLLTELIFMPL
jgi:hypothetical protein